MIRRLLQSALFLFSVLICTAAPAGDGKPLHVKEAWSVNEHGVLLALSENFSTDGRNFELPEEVDTDGFWGGVLLTDGKEIFAVMSLPMRDADFKLEDVDTGDFRERLSKNGWIETRRYDRPWKMQKRENRLVLYSEHLAESRLENVDLDAILLPLRITYVVALSTAFPENKLYPTLPEKKDDEPRFVREVRESRRKAKEKSNETNDTALSLLGLRWNDDQTGTAEFITLREESAKKVRREDRRPFEVAGFHRVREESAQTAKPEWNTTWKHAKKNDTKKSDRKKPDDDKTKGLEPGSFQTPEFYLTGAYRYVPEIADGKDDQLFCLYLGTKIIPKDERKEPDFRRHYMQFGLATVTSLESLGTSVTDGVDWKNTHMIRRENICVFYPKQAENLPPEDGQPGPEEMDEINRNVAEAVFPVAEVASKVFGNLSFDFPIDIGIQLENGVAYVGISILSEKEMIDENLPKSFWKYIDVFESLLEGIVKKTKDEVTKSDKDISTEHLKTNEFSEMFQSFRKMFGETVTEDGISYTRISIPNKEENGPATTLIVGFGKNFLCGAFPTGPRLSTPTMLDYIVFPNLKNRVAESRRLKEESPWTPRSSFQVQRGEHRFNGYHLDDGRKTIFSVAFLRTSLGELGSLRSLPGLEYVRMVAPEIVPDFPEPIVSEPRP